MSENTVTVKPGHSAHGGEVRLRERLDRLFWLFVLVGHGACAALWWWLMPGGFPVRTVRFWVNSVAPLVLLGWCAAAFFAAQRRRTILYQLMLLGFPAGWLGAAIAGRVAFPTSARLLWMVPMAGAAAMIASVAGSLWRLRSRSWRWALTIVLVAAIAGVALPLSVKAPLSSTRPLSQEPPEFTFQSRSAFPETRSIGKGVMVHGSDGSLTVRAGRMTVFVHPVLTFLSRSPDGCWTLFSARSDREPQPFRLDGVGEAGGTLGFAYRGLGPATLFVRDRANGDISLEAFTELGAPIYSHLNAFCDLEFTGHQRLQLGFSACPRLRADVLPFDYPFGRPARVAYLDGSGTFHVAEATSGEKGPFHDLGTGPMQRTDPLSITVYDEGQPVLRVTWDDWAAQASTALSPTAGWGLPVNAIEFSLSADSPRSMASLFMTLAGTSVGRGWDSVGHARGTYRNRMRIERIGDSTAPGSEPAKP